MNEWLHPNVKKVLDVGCGAGVYSVLSGKKHAMQVTGIDVSEASLKKARAWARKENLKNVKFINQDFLGKKIKPASFDLVIASEALEHLPSIDSGLKEVSRVLKASGEALISLPNSSSIFWKLFHAGQALGFKRPEKLGREQHHEIPLHGILDLIEKNNFKLVEMKGVMLFPFPLIFNFLPCFIGKPMRFLAFFWEKTDSALGKSFLKQFGASIIIRLEKR